MFETHENTGISPRKMKVSFYVSDDGKPSVPFVISAF